jgi:hypothetical protein
MMKTVRNLTVLAAGAGLLTLVTATAALGASSRQPQRQVLPQSDHANQMGAFFYVGAVGSTGKFPGTLLCLRTGRQFIPVRIDRCAKKDHLYALSTQDGSMIHPLLAADPQTLEKLPKLVGKKVVVDGKYYESVGVLVAGNIRARG